MFRRALGKSIAKSRAFGAKPDPKDRFVYAGGEDDGLVIRWFDAKKKDEDETVVRMPGRRGAGYALVKSESELLHRK